ncbi:pyrophosphatase PpaX [Paenibacillus flagellatus]|uniref:Pyrophosphatase PpaX n=1 Tax=Paenibacillus flagellatus TaxID=2211139 RepID=A0A2V5JWW4_9BACL|nr:pyrophosphatase PpaX [Paenibacillus flagellatus]PYI51299.1 pyrophosphatase PpaX [Paenibacillus flagellatus]
MAIAAMLFDLDGTIVDTNELIIQSFLHTLEGETEEPFTRERIVPHMGFPLLEQLRFFTGKEDVDELVVKYRQFNLSRHDELVTEFPHVREVLAELRGRGVKLGVVTNKMRQTTLMGLKLCGLEPYMEAIVTVDDVTRGKPDPEPVTKGLERLGVSAGETLMIGDSQYDIVAGREAGTRTAGVSWSLKGETYLRSFKPDYIIRDMRELLDIVG